MPTKPQMKELLHHESANLFHTDHHCSPSQIVCNHVTNEDSHFIFFIAREDSSGKEMLTQEVLIEQPPFMLISFLPPFSINRNMLALRRKDSQQDLNFHEQVN